jgi:hypothetical protein
VGEKVDRHSGVAQHAPSMFDLVCARTFGVSCRRWTAELPVHGFGRYNHDEFARAEAQLEVEGYAVVQVKPSPEPLHLPTPNASTNMQAFFFSSQNILEKAWM